MQHTVVNLHFNYCLQSSYLAVCRYGSSAAAVRIALSTDDIRDAQVEVEAYNCLQHLQGKHVPQLLGYGQSGQGFCVATSYVQVCYTYSCLPWCFMWIPKAFVTDTIMQACDNYWVCGVNALPLNEGLSSLRLVLLAKPSQH